MSDNELLRDSNSLARQLADLRDSMDTFRKEMAETQERWMLERARLELAAGMSEDLVPEHLWEDGPQIAQVALDRVWDAGYRDGVAAAVQAISKLSADAGFPS